MDSFHRGFERLMLFEGYIFNEIAHRDTINSIICGGIAGVVAKTAVAPAERVKMSYQTSTDTFTLRDAWNRGVGMAQKGGITSLWKGHSTTIVRVAPYAGLSYAAHDAAEAQFKRLLNEERLPLMYKFLAGSIGGATGTFFTYPLDVLRVRLALIPNSTWSSCIKQGGLFQGISPTVMGIIPYAGTSWMVKQTLHEAFPPLFHRRPSVFESLVMNSLAGLSAQLVTYPLDIVRRRMQMATYEKGKPPPSVANMIRHLIETEGIRGMTKGFSLNIFKGPITLSLSLTTYDLLRSYFEGRKVAPPPSSPSSSSTPSSS